MKSNILFLALVSSACLILFSACNGTKPATDASNGAPPKEAAGSDSITMDNAGALPGDMDLSHKYSFGAMNSRDLDGDGSMDEYALSVDNMQVTKDVSVEKTLVYDKNPDGLFAGTLSLHFSGPQGTAQDVDYVEDIPKSFASDVKYLMFSVQPDKIVKADPQVEWTKSITGAMDVKVSSTEEKTAQEAAAGTEDYAVNSGLVSCKTLSGQASYLCALELIRKYRSNHIIQQQFSSMDQSKPGGALAAAIIYDDPAKYCNRLASEADTLLCRKYAFAMKERDCEEGPAADSADCIRKGMWQINNYKTIKDACVYITDAGLKAECMGEVDPSYCDGIADADLRDKCMVHVAYSKSDPSMCKQVKSEELKDICNYRLSQGNADPGICNAIKDEDSRDQCIAEMASSRGDLKLCDQLKDPDHRDVCKTVTAFSGTMSNKTDYFSTMSLCDKINTNQEMHDLCIGLVAVRTRNPDVCDKIGSDTRDTCLLVFFMLNDLSICDRIKDAYLRDSCIKLIAENTKDAQMCENIDDEDMKKECIKELSGPATTSTTVPAQTAQSVASPDCSVVLPSGTQKKEGSPNGKPEVWYMFGQKMIGPDIIYTDASKTKIVVQKCFDLDGKEEGLWIAWDSDRNKQWEHSYSHGVLNGPNKEWRQGKPFEDGFYRGGKEDGLWRSWSDGVLSSEENYKLGKKDGIQKYYYSNGQLKKQESYKDGVWDGNSISYGEDGKKEYEYVGTNVNNKFTGTYTDWTIGSQCPMTNGEMGKCKQVSG